MPESHSSFKSARSLLFILCLSLLGSGCASLRYLVQASVGQMSLVSHARPIPDVLQDERTPPRIRELLGQIPEIKKFAESNGIRPTGNYIEYVKLDRPAAVWVVSACEPLKFKSKVWNFPFVGSFPYLGWFHLDDAKEYAAEVRKEKEGWDVDVRGASAYSTLGWFRDAVLSSMIPEGKQALGQLANTVIHESVHATVYIKGEAYFNESIAMWVAGKLTPIYLDRARGPDSPEKAAYMKKEEESEAQELRLHDAYERLNALYGSDKPDGEKLEEKRKIFAALREELQIKREINNATLVQYKEYSVPSHDFQELFEACGSDWKRFWSTVIQLKPSSFQQSQQVNFAPVLGSLKATCR